MKNHFLKTSKFRKASLSIFLLSSLCVVGYAAPQSSKTTSLVPLPNSVLPIISKSMPAVTLFQPRGSIGALTTAAPFEVAISLKPRDEAGLQAFADAVSNPNSPEYRHFITPEEVGQRFGASEADVNAVKAFLIRGGLTINHVGKTNITISATGTQAQVEALFATKIGNYQVVENAETITYRANMTALNVPSTLVNKIQSIDGVESYTRPKPRGTTLTPAKTRQIYGLNTAFSAGWTGAGRTVGISSWDGFQLNNGNLFITQFSLPTPAGGAMSNVSVVHVGTGTQNGTAFGEADLDFQMVLGAAPLANIVIYDGTGGNLTTVLSTEISANVSDIISESYGWTLGSGTASTAHTHHLSMTAIGMTYMAASGDSGTALNQYDYPDYDPEVLMVGGTIATTDASGNRTSETTWGLAGGDAGGGGWCTSATANSASFNVRPSWQTGTGVPSSATVNKRLVPDVALHASGTNGFANPYAYYMYYGGSLSASSGTSASSPTFAAGLAVVQQRLYSTGGRGANVNKGRLGRVQDRIYAQNGRSDVWYDITTGTSIGNLPSSGGGSLNGTAANATAGWDFATGWGSINFNAFYKTFFEGR